MLEVVVFYDVITMMYICGYRTNHQQRVKYCYRFENALWFDPDSRYDIIQKRFEMASGKRLVVERHKIPTE